MRKFFDYLMMKDLDISSQLDYSKKIYSFLFMLNFEYPDFARWYHSLYNSKGLLKTDREILLCLIDGNVAGVLILKHNENENKICTLRVAPKYQGLGIGSTLIEKSFDFFNTDKPLITIHISKYHEFKSLFERYNFSLEQQVQGYYGLLKSELSYNGILADRAINNPSFFEQIVFGIEKYIYNYPSLDSKIYIPNPIKKLNSSLLINNIITPPKHILKF